mmetsp:Transcript_15185/g.52753  ORF Transcript_15185/g.52753 Transcript_15185/m.52753 type:complete len:789 (-) Transcript_15185:121-2487(-)
MQRGVAIVVVGVLIVATAGALIGTSTESRSSAVLQLLEREADHRAAALSAALNKWNVISLAVGTTLALKNVSRDEILDIAGSFASKELISLSWASLVHAGEEEAWKGKAASASGCDPDGISIHNVRELDEPRSPGGMYLPLLESTFPGDYCAIVVGFDLLSPLESNTARRVAAEEAMATGNQVTTAPFYAPTVGSVIQSVFTPIVVDTEFAGMLSTAFNGRNLVDATETTASRSDVSVRVTDVESGITVAGPVEPSDLEATRIVSLHGFKWRLDVVASDAFDERVPQGHVTVAWAAGVVVLVAAIWLAVLQRNERAVQEALTRLLFDMSHDLRTPLHAIQGCVELLGDAVKDESEEIRSSLSTLEWCSTLLRGIVDNVLDVKHIGSGDVSYQDSPTLPMDVLRGAIAIVSGTLVNSDTTLDADFSADAEDVVCMIDREKLLRVCLNVVGNACKFTPHGRVVVTARMEAVGEGIGEKVQLRVVVQDDGVGMSPEELKNALVVYAHAPRSKGGGSGIGLFVTSRIVDHYGGKLVVESEGEGRGSTVSFTMIVNRATEAAMPFDRGLGARLDPSRSSTDALDTPTDSNGSSVRSPTGGAADMSGGEGGAAGGAGSGGASDGAHVTIAPVSPVSAADVDVLVVDDVALNRRVTRFSLDAHAPNLLEASDGSEALSMMKDRTLRGVQTFVFMDIAMPVMSGDAALRAYREWCEQQGVPRQRQAWVCALTGDVASSAARFTSMGFDAVLTKPCGRSQLRDALVRAQRARSGSGGAGGRSSGTALVVDSSIPEHA